MNFVAFSSNFARIVTRISPVFSSSFLFSSLKMPHILVPLANGVEEMETVITVDVLRRAGITVTMASLLDYKEIKCSRNVVLVADELYSNIVDKLDTFDGVVLPGGIDAANAYKDSESIGQLLKKFEADNKLLAIICASPIALASHKIGLEKRVTSHPSVSNRLTDHYKYLEDRVVVDGNLITSRAPGTAFDFALEIVRSLLGDAKVEETKKPMLLA